MSVLPLEDVSFDADTRTGTIQLGGGLVVAGPGGAQIALVDPEIVIGATTDASGLFATVDGVRVKVGDLDTAARSPTTSPTAPSRSTTSTSPSAAPWQPDRSAASSAPA